MKQSPLQAKKIILEKEREKNFYRHINNLHKTYDKDYEIQDTVNSIQEKLDFSHKNRFYSKKFKQDQENTKIQYENKKLLSAIVSIGEYDKSIIHKEDQSFYLTKQSSKQFQKYLENQKIQNENFQLAYRMVNLPSVYPKKSYDANYKLHKRRVAQIQKFQRDQSFEPFQQHQSPRLTHHSLSPIQRCQRLINSGQQNIKVDQAQQSIQEESLVQDDKVFEEDINQNSYEKQKQDSEKNTISQKNKYYDNSSQNSNSQQIRKHERSNSGQLINYLSHQKRVFTQNDRYYGEPQKEHSNIFEQAQQIRLKSLRSQSLKGDIIQNKTVQNRSDSLDINKQLLLSQLKDSDKYAQTEGSIQCLSPKKTNKSEIKLIMKVQNLSLKIKPRTDDSNDQFYFEFKMAGHKKKSTSFFQYQQIQHVEFSFNLKINNDSSILRQDSVEYDNKQEKNETSKQNQIKCFLLQNKGNIAYVIGYFHLDVDSCKQGVNEIHTQIFIKDDESQVIGQITIFLNIELSKNILNKKSFKQIESFEQSQEKQQIQYYPILSQQLKKNYFRQIDQNPKQKQNESIQTNTQDDSKIQRSSSDAAAIQNYYIKNYRNNDGNKKWRQFYCHQSQNSPQKLTKKNSISIENCQVNQNIEYGYEPKLQDEKQFYRNKKITPIDKPFLLKNEYAIVSPNHQKRKIILPRVELNNSPQ